MEKWASVMGPLLCVRTDVGGTQILAQKFFSAETPTYVYSKWSARRGDHFEPYILGSTPCVCIFFASHFLQSQLASSPGMH